jgi:hypothetical protein
MPMDTYRDVIERLEAEERMIRSREETTGPGEHDVERLREIEVEMARLWDLVRQREALRDAGRDPDEASPRDADTVTQYEQ